MGTILSSGYLQSILSSAVQSIGPAAKKPAGSSGGGNVTSVAQQADNGQLSPFAQLVNTLQQLQQSNPAQYQQVTQQIATNLQNAAQTAQTSGNPAVANQLSQLATDFSNASQNGKLPSFQDLAQGVFGHHHHHTEAAGGDSGGASGSEAVNASMNQALSQMLSAFEASGTQNGALNPLTIISNTLSSAGIGK